MNTRHSNSIAVSSGPTHDTISSHPPQNINITDASSAPKGIRAVQFCNTNFLDELLDALHNVLVELDGLDGTPRERVHLGLGDGWLDIVEARELKKQ